MAGYELMVPMFGGSTELYAAGRDMTVAELYAELAADDPIWTTQKLRFKPLTPERIAKHWKWHRRVSFVARHVGTP